MHLLAVTPGAICDGEEAVDLAQSPGKIVLLTVADSELACFSKAADGLGDGFPTVRLANLLQLKHPYSVDLYVEKVIAHARFVCVVLLGGRSYWPYGVDEIAVVARERGIAFAALSDGMERDASLEACSTLSPETLDRLRDYLRQGGVANATSFLRTAARLIGRGRSRRPTPRPCRTPASMSAAWRRRRWRRCRPDGRPAVRWRCSPSTAHLWSPARPTRWTP